MELFFCFKVKVCLLMKNYFRNISCYSLFLVLVFLPVLLFAAPKDGAPTTDLYQQVDHFFRSHQTTSESVAQTAHQIVQKLISESKDIDSFIERIRELESYLHMIYDFSNLKALQRALLLEKGINAHLEAWNRETRHKRAVITWAAIIIGALIGIVGAIIGAAKEDHIDMPLVKDRSKKTVVNILIWAPLATGAGLSIAQLITAKIVEEHQMLLVHPAEFIQVQSGDVTMYDIEDYLKTFLTLENEFARSQARKKLHALHSKLPEQVETRLHYMKEILEYAPPKFSHFQKKQQGRLQTLLEDFSLQSFLLSPWDRLMDFLSDHLYGLAMAGAFLGAVIFLLSLYLSGGWTWPSLVLSLLIGLNVGLSLGEMVGNLIEKEVAQEIIDYESLF